MLDAPSISAEVEETAGLRAKNLGHSLVALQRPFDMHCQEPGLRILSDEFPAGAVRRRHQDVPTNARA